MTINLSEHAGGGEIFLPTLLQYDGSSRFGGVLGTTAGNKFFAVIQFKGSEFTGASTRRTLAIKHTGGTFRFLLTYYSNDHVNVERRNKVSVYTANGASVTLSSIISTTEIMDDNLHTLFYSVDHDTGNFTFVIDGNHEDDLTWVDRIFITGTLASGASTTMAIASLYHDVDDGNWVGACGYIGYGDGYRTDWQTFMEEDGSPKNIDGSGFLFFNEHGDGQNNKGTGNNLTEYGSVIVSDINSILIPTLGLPTIGDAVPADILTDKIAWVDGVRLVGTGSGAGQPDLTGLNLILKSRDLTDAAWTDVASPTATYNQIGLDGAANTATRLTDATGTHDGKAQNGIPNGGVVVTARWFVKMEASQPFSLMDMNGIASTYFMYNIPDAEGQPLGLAFGASSTGVTYYKIRSHQYTGWWEIGLQLDNPGNDAGLEIYPARGATFNANIGGTTGSCTIGNMELYDGLTIADIIMQPAEYND